MATVLVVGEEGFDMDTEIADVAEAPAWSGRG